MSTDSKVLVFPQVGQKSAKSPNLEGDSAPIVNIGEMRKEIIQEERRSVRRTILSDFIGVHVVVPGLGLQKCTLIDISEKGMAFDLEKKVGGLKEGEKVAMRVYLNHQTYFGFFVTIQSRRFIDDEAAYRHGSSFIAGTVNQEALMHFVGFIESVSASLKTDHGDVMVSNLDVK